MRWPQEAGLQEEAAAVTSREARGRPLRQSPETAEGRVLGTAPQSPCSAEGRRRACGKEGPQWALGLPGRGSGVRQGQGRPSVRLPWASCWGQSRPGQ